MAIIAKAKKGDDNNNLIKKFKKLLMIDDIVTAVRDRRYHKPPATLKKEAKKALANRLHIEKKQLKRGVRRPVRQSTLPPRRDY
jgi:ribosomal protein S21